MILHRTFGERLLSDEKVSHEDRATVLWKRRAIDRLVCAQGLHQGFGNRADVAASVSNRRSSSTSRKTSARRPDEANQGQPGFQNRFARPEQSGTSAR